MIVIDNDAARPSLMSLEKKSDNEEWDAKSGK